MSDYTDKFRTEFPSGVVPTNRPPKVGDGDLLDELLKRVEGHDFVHAAFNVPTLDQLQTSYLYKLTLGLDANDEVVAMMREGLTLRQIARYTGQGTGQLVADLSHFKSWGRTEAWLQADELFLAGGSVKGVARATGLAITTARFIRDLRCASDGPSVTPDGPRGVRCAA